MLGGRSSISNSSTLNVIADKIKNAMKKDSSSKINNSKKEENDEEI
jgi:hypothetical protein